MNIIIIAHSHLEILPKNAFVAGQAVFLSFSFAPLILLFFFFFNGANTPRGGGGGEII